MSKSKKQQPVRGFVNCITELKRRLETNLITVEDLVQNMPDVDYEVIELLLLNNTTNFPEQVDKIFEFAKLKLWLNRNAKLKPYNIFLSRNKVRLRCNRTIEPRCTVQYDFATGKYYNFKQKTPMSKVREEVIRHEMRIVVEDYMDRHKKNIHNIW